MTTRERLAQFEIAQTIEGLPLQLAGPADEMVCLAFDTGRKRLVEVHLPKLPRSQELDDNVRRAFFEVALLVADFRGDRCLAQVIDAGEEHGLLYYVTDLNEGESVESYLGRVGALSSLRAHTLILDLCEGLIRLEERIDLLPSIGLGGALLMADAADQHYLRLVDLGLSGTVSGVRNLEESNAGLIRGMIDLLAELLGGVPEDGNPAKRLEVLGDDLVKLRDRPSPTLREFGHSLVQSHPEEFENASAAQRGRFTKFGFGKAINCVVDDLLPATEHLPEKLGISFSDRGKGSSLAGRRMRIVECADSGRRLGIHAIPSGRIISASHYEAIPNSMWGGDAEGKMNLLRGSECFQAGGSILVSEDSLPGFSLARLLAVRGSLSAVEAAGLLEQVYGGIDQATECGLMLPSLHPTTIHIAFARTATEADCERLLGVDVGEWPSHYLKLRGHHTLAKFLEPPLYERIFPQGSYGEGRSHSDQIRLEALALTQALVAGTGDDALGEDLLDYVEDHLAREASTPASVDLERFVHGFCNQARSQVRATSVLAPEARSKPSDKPASPFVARDKAERIFLRADPAECPDNGLEKDPQVSPPPLIQDTPLPEKSVAETPSKVLPEFPRVLSSDTLANALDVTEESSARSRISRLTRPLKQRATAPTAFSKDSSSVNTTKIRAKALKRYFDEEDKLREDADSGEPDVQAMEGEAEPTKRNFWTGRAVKNISEDRIRRWQDALEPVVTRIRPLPVGADRDAAEFLASKSSGGWARGALLPPALGLALLVLLGFLVSTIYTELTRKGMRPAIADSDLPEIREADELGVGSGVSIAGPSPQEDAMFESVDGLMDHRGRPEPGVSVLQTDIPGPGESYEPKLRYDQAGANTDQAPANERKIDQPADNVEIRRAMPVDLGGGANATAPVRGKPASIGDAIRRGVSDVPMLRYPGQ